MDFPIKPTLGRNVLYQKSLGEAGIRTATICRVNSAAEGSVNLVICGAGSGEPATELVTSVSYDAEGDAHTWRWPDYVLEREAPAYAKAAGRATL